MIRLDGIIGTLLLRNNCVIIPSLGGFVANNVAAQIDYQTGTIYPPKKLLSFNKNLQNNDGLVISYFAETNKITYEEAEELIRKEVLVMKNTLQKEQRVHFENVGYLYVNNAGKIAFEQDRFFNLLLASFGMGKIQFIEEKGEETQPTISKVAVDAPVEIQKEEEKEETKVIPLVASIPETTEELPIVGATPEPSKRRLGKIVKIVAAAALVPFLFYSFWIPMKTDVLQSKIIYSFDFNPFKERATQQYEINKKAPETMNINYIHPNRDLEKITENLNSDAKVFTYPLRNDFYVKVENTEGKEIEKYLAVESLSSSEETIPVSIESGYHLIVGCFGEQQNAQNLINKLNSEGFKAYEVDVKGGLHRISAGFSNSKTEVLELKNLVTQNNYSSWVLKK